MYPLDAESKPIISGWHFSWMGDNSRMKLKAKSYAHSMDTRSYCFQTAIADLNSEAMIDYLDSYAPAVGSSDAYGRSDHMLNEYPVENLPGMIFEHPTIKNFLFQDTKKMS
jgi:hypothetical protein